MKEGTANHAVYRDQYTPYPWILKTASIRFDIEEACTRVASNLEFEAAFEGGAEDIVLNGEHMELVSLKRDGNVLEESEFSLTDSLLTIHGNSGSCQLEIEVLIRPQENTALEGLYPSGDFLLTQCEAEGFRKITYFPDRPDVMTRYDVTIVADRERYPVLLSNGNAVDSGGLDDGRHWVRWVDPFAKPSYLFALVAGDLACIQDRFTTRSGRQVDLRIYVEHENLDKCSHAMESLIRSMEWDENRFGLEYDLDIYNIVATNDFNMGAMENKSLNIFNSKYVLASPETATDTDYQGIESVIGHEYFHNWTGNRVTCQDWFQLTLKEGLTVFRDQEFSSDMQSRAVKRIQDVRALRARQFPEDSGPMAHPIRPDKYKEINNFYTMTVYQKGAEVIRMYHTLLGEEGFQQGMRLYFERHDGAAVTCDDFLAAMADANDADLDKFGRWYGQSGTPVLRVRSDYDPDNRRYTLYLSQQTPATADQAQKQPLVIPIALGLLSPSGQAYPLRLAQEDRARNSERVLVLDEAEKSFVFQDIPEKPIPSLLRDFSAPVRLEYAYSQQELALLMAHDVNAFTRWEAAQLLAQREILANVDRRARGLELELAAPLVEAFRLLLQDDDSDPALVAEAMGLPDEDYLAGQMDIVDVDGIHAARRFIKAGLAEALCGRLAELYRELRADGVYDKSSAAIARRSLRNACLSYLMHTSQGEDLANEQFATSDNMTDRLAALSALAWSECDSAAAALGAFEEQWKNDALVMDKWFAIQASVPGPATVTRVKELLQHPAFSIRNPNKVRSVIGVFSMANPTAFHSSDGSGYRLHAEKVVELDALNPQVAARMVGAFNPWTRHDSKRRALMKQSLSMIAEKDGLSADVSEIVNNALAMGQLGTQDA
jgi:aminopeptidase N